MFCEDKLPGSQMTVFSLYLYIANGRKDLLEKESLYKGIKLFLKSSALLT